MINDDNTLSPRNNQELVLGVNENNLDILLVSKGDKMRRLVFLDFDLALGVHMSTIEVTKEEARLKDAEMLSRVDSILADTDLMKQFKADGFVRLPDLGNRPTILIV